MDQLRKLLSTLDLRQRITIGVVAIAVFASIFGLSHWRTESDFKPLYTSLAPEDAALVIQKLKEAGSDYRVSENGTSVLAPSARVPELRLELAAAGVPRTGRIGYELFDKTNLGATEFAEHLNYHRALEGELERSIGSLSAVDQARVHLTFPRESVFLDSREPAKASVLLKLRPGAQLSAQNIAAVTNLVGSAVEGLAPEAVTVMDMRGNLLNRPHRDLNGDAPSEATLEYRQKVENDLLAKINATLEPLLGSDRFRAGISVDCDFTSGEQSEETLDPNKSVMLASQKTEEQTGGSLASGQPGTASTLPRPTSRPGSSGSGLSRRTENIQFESSRVVRHVKLAQGTIKRMSISILVAHDVHMEGTGKKAKRVVTPPPPETLKAIHELVAAVTGFSTERGDQLVIESLPFDASHDIDPGMGAPAPAPVDTRVPSFLRPFFPSFDLLLTAVAALAGVLVLAIGLLFVLLKGKSKSAEIEEKVELAKTLTAEEVRAQIEAEFANKKALQDAHQVQEEREMLNNMNIQVNTTKKAEVLVRHLRDNVTKDSEATSNVLRSWLNGTEGH
jgi:flagellar M-ring protein FliF